MRGSLLSPRSTSLASAPYRFAEPGQLVDERDRRAPETRSARAWSSRPTPATSSSMLRVNGAKQRATSRRSAARRPIPTTTRSGLRKLSIALPRRRFSGEYASEAAGRGAAQRRPGAAVKPTGTWEETSTSRRRPEAQGGPLPSRRRTKRDVRLVPVVDRRVECHPQRSASVTAVSRIGRERRGVRRPVRSRDEVGAAPAPPREAGRRQAPTIAPGPGRARPPGTRPSARQAAVDAAEVPEPVRRRCAVHRDRRHRALEHPRVGPQVLERSGRRPRGSTASAASRAPGSARVEEDERAVADPAPLAAGVAARRG